MLPCRQPQIPPVRPGGLRKAAQPLRPAAEVLLLQIAQSTPRRQTVYPGQMSRRDHQHQCCDPASALRFRVVKRFFRRFIRHPPPMAAEQTAGRTGPPAFVCNLHRVAVVHRRFIHKGPLRAGSPAGRKSAGAARDPQYFLPTEGIDQFRRLHKGIVVPAAQSHIGHAASRRRS